MTDGAPHEYLDLVTTLRAERTVLQNEIALVYDAPGPHAIVDHDILEKGVESFNLDPAKPLLNADGQITVWQDQELRSSFFIGRNSALSYCPRSVRVVPRSGLALALAPDLLTREGQAARLRAVKNASPLAVLMDSVLKGGLVVGAALNTADTTVRDMVVGLAFTPDTVAHNEVDSTRSADTLEFHVGDVAPHTVATFAGGRLWGGDHVLARVTYHSADVQGRAIAGDDRMNRASYALRTPSADVGVKVACKSQVAACDRRSAP
jgi:hypothetical protein